MYSLIFRLVPWWLYALIGISMAPLALQFVEEYRTAQIDFDIAIAVGPPLVTPIAQFRGPGVTPLDEVQLSGVIRKDLGIIEVEGGAVDQVFVVISDDSRTGPVIALIAPSFQSERMLDQLLDNAGQDGSVVVQGLLTTSHLSDVRGALALRNERAPVYIVEPFLNDREAALREKAQDTLIALGIFGAITVFAFLVAFLRFRAWRQRRALKRARKSAAVRARTAASPTPSPIASVASASPWSAGQAQNRALSNSATPVASVATQEVKKQSARAKPQPQTTVPPSAPAFESVFPNGGSAFLFKTADEIIVQSFGTTSTSRASSVQINTPKSAE